MRNSSDSPADNMKPQILGITGPSSSGKTELARQIISRLPGTSLISLDSYYLGMEEIPLAERKKVNFDHPDAVDWKLLRLHLRLLMEGRSFNEPVYSFAEYARTPETRLVTPSEFAIVEGLFVFYWPELRELLDMKIYVQTAPEVCFERRLCRDVAERGRTPESVREQYERTVLPGAEWFVMPTRKYADLVVSGEEPLTCSTAAVLRALNVNAGTYCAGA